MEAKGTETTGRVLEDSDREWYTRDHQQFVSWNQEGDVAGHYMQVDGKAVFTNAICTNQRTIFKTHTILEVDEGDFRPIVMLENKHDGSVVAINKDDESVIAKKLSTPPSDYTNLQQVKNDHPEILFYKEHQEPGSEFFFFKSYLKDKRRILGFDTNGRALNPTLIEPTQKECLFSMI